MSSFKSIYTADFSITTAIEFIIYYFKDWFPLALFNPFNIVSHKYLRGQIVLKT